MTCEGRGAARWSVKLPVSTQRSADPGITSSVHPLLSVLCLFALQLQFYFNITSLFLSVHLKLVCGYVSRCNSNHHTTPSYPQGRMFGDELSASEEASDGEEFDKDPLAESDESSSQSSNEGDVDDVYETFYDLSDQSIDESGFSNDSSDEEPPPKKRKNGVLKKSEKSYKWKKVAQIPEAYTRIKSQSSSSRQPTSSNISTDPLDIFSKYFTESFVSLTVKLTNLRAVKCSLELNLTECELKAFIGILIIMGFHRLPGIYYYWKANANFGVPRVSSVMTVKRFLSILRFLSFNDSSRTPKKSQAGSDDFHSIRLVVDHLNEKFSDIMEPSDWLNINESTVRPRILKTGHDRNYERKFRVTALCCAKSGYLFKLNVQDPKLYANSEPNVNDSIVRDLLSVVKTEGCTVVFGRDYTNFPLVEELYSRNIFVCSELNRRCDPNIPNKFREGNIRSGDFIQSGDFSITVWKDTHVSKALILSTMHNPSEKKSALKRKINELVDFPAPVVDYYDHHREGVKLFDTLRLRYNTYWKSRKWTTRFFYYMLDATIVNSYIVYKKSSEKIKRENPEDPLSIVQFRSNLADGLIAGFVGRKRSTPNPQTVKGKSKKKNSSRATSVENSVRMTDVGSHMPTKTTCRRCAFCSTKGRTKRSNIMCTACQVGLCILCFAPFHEMPQE